MSKLWVGALVLIGAIAAIAFAKNNGVKVEPTGATDVSTRKSAPSGSPTSGIPVGSIVTTTQEAQLQRLPQTMANVTSTTGVTSSSSLNVITPTYTAQQILDKIRELQAAQRKAQTDYTRQYIQPLTDTLRSRDGIYQMIKSGGYRGSALANLYNQASMIEQKIQEHKDYMVANVLAPYEVEIAQWTDLYQPLKKQERAEYEARVGYL